MTRALLIVIVIVVAFASTAAAQGQDDPGPWGISIWGLSYHVDSSIDYASANYGAGVRYYLARHVFVEGDVLRNSNRGVVLPVSLGVEVPAGSIGACRVGAIGALTLAYYQNLRTESDYVKVGPVPGVSFTCGIFKPTVVVILSPSHQPVAAIAATLTILLPFSK
jgi:hypothetical protein